MQVTWLHVSDFHIRGGDPYDRDVVLRALVKSVQDFRQRGRTPDLVFATGDIAHAGKAPEYDLATQFFDALIAAAGVDRRHLFIIPGNHDVDRELGIGLARTLESREQADSYFNPAIPKLHLTLKQGAFLQWYNRYFDGIRAFPVDSTCGPVEMVDVRGFTIGILPLNSALFCQGDDDHEKLWIGRRCLAAALDKLQALGAQINVALVHHPLEWLESQERANIRAELHAKVDFILRGHLHETDVESVVGASGAALHVAAGAAYQTRRWPNRALYATIEVDRLTVFPIRYADQPRDVWTVDPSLFPSEANYEKSFSIARLAWSEQEPRPAPPEMAPAWASLPRFQSNIPSRRNLPFVGRESGDTPNESTSSVERDQIFISYSHKDVKWLERIQVHLKSLERLGTVKRWDDTMIKPGTKWREEIRRALESAKVAVLLISADFLASEFIITNELPLLLAAAAKRGVVILPIIVNPCRFEQTKILSEFQAVNPPTRPLGMMNRSRQEAVFVAMTRAIEDALQS